MLSRGSAGVGSRTIVKFGQGRAAVHVRGETLQHWRATLLYRRMMLLNWGMTLLDGGMALLDGGVSLWNRRVPLVRHRRMALN